MKTLKVDLSEYNGIVQSELRITPVVGGGYLLKKHCVTGNHFVGLIDDDSAARLVDYFNKDLQPTSRFQQRLAEELKKADPAPQSSPQSSPVSGEQMVWINTYSELIHTQGRNSAAEEADRAVELFNERFK